MYSLKKTGVLELEQLVILLKPHGYVICKKPMGICKYKTCPITFLSCSMVLG